MRRNLIVIVWILGSLLASWLGMYISAQCLLSTLKGLNRREHLELIFAVANFVSWSGMLIVPGLFTVLAVKGRLPGTRQSGEPPPAPAHWPRFLWSAGSVALFAIACMLPACRLIDGTMNFGSGTRYTESDIWGYPALILGFFHLSWWANPLWALANLLLLLRRYRIALWCALGAVILASSVWVYPLLPGEFINKIEQVYIGAYYWWASMVVLLVGSLLHWWRFHKAQATRR